ncbi:hypothetical protein [Marinitoga lauensis]|uniref:hypothetical protein n=1 Tax=Marinitoga lauensis TaxID=2201189 RepID=UPI001F0FA028|nr:hypothetical protein [Marinitoga lauensis]
MIEEKIFLKSDLDKSMENYEFPGLKKSLKMNSENIVKKITESGLRVEVEQGFLLEKNGNLH